MHGCWGQREQFLDHIRDQRDGWSDREHCWFSPAQRQVAVIFEGKDFIQDVVDASPLPTALQPLATIQDADSRDSHSAGPALSVKRKNW